MALSDNTILYNVHYDLDGGEGITNRDSAYFPGETMEVIWEIPTKEGYDFGGWYRDDTQMFYYAGDTYVLNKDGIVFKAIWYEIPIGTVTFELYGGTGDFPPISFRFDKGFTVPEAVPEWEGYDFFGWSTPDGQHFYPGQICNLYEEECVLLALWSYGTHTMTFDPNGGSFESEGGETLEVSSWQTFTMNAPLREGYSFLYWEDEEGNHYVEGAEYNVGARDMTFMAYWEKALLHNISFNLNGGIYNFLVETALNGEELTLYQPEKYPHEFLYWEDQDGNRYDALESLYITKDMTFTAVWRQINSYLIIFDALGGSSDNFSDEYIPEGVELYIQPAVKEGKTFICWKDEEGTELYAGSYYTITKPATFTAVWDTPVYAVKYEGVDTTDYVDLGDSLAVTSVVPEKEGHNFVCWTIGENNYNAGDIVTPTEDMTFSAQWQRFANIMTFEGTDVNELVNVGDSYIITSTVPSKEGHDFVCWRIGDDTYNAGDLITPTADMTFEAVWNPHRYTISFDLNGGSGAFTPIEKTYNVDVTIPESTPTKDGINFVYWTDSSGRVYYPGDVISFNENITLTAVWMADTYTLSFDLNGRIGSYEPIVRCGGGRVVLSNTPARVGYIFNSWRNKDDTVYLPGSEYVFSNCDDTLVAIWEEKTYDVTFDLDGGSWEMSEQKKSYYSNYTLPTLEPTKEKHIFYRWVDENNMAYNPGGLYKKNQPVTLKALWKEIYTITYLDRDGNVFATQENVEGETITLISEYPRISDGYFSHWGVEGYTSRYFPGKEFSASRDIVLTPVFDFNYELNLYNGNNLFMELKSTGSGRFYLSTDIPAKEGYDFVCWRNEENGALGFPGQLYLAGGVSEELQAVFAESTDRIVIYDLDGGTGNFPDQTAGESEYITTPSQVPEKEGYIFDCWEIVYANADTYCINYRLSPDSPFPDTCDMVLRALWIKVRVTINNLPANGVINRATTPSLQLEAEVYPTASDFSSTWSMPESRAMTRAASTGNNFTVTKEWVSSDESIATVDQNGKVTFKKSGIVLISFCTTFYFKNATIYFYSKRTLYVYKLEEDENVFTDDTKIPEEVRGRALEKMNAYYNDNPEIKAVVDGTNPDCNTCIFAFEGLGNGHQGNNATTNPNYHINGGYLKAMMIVTKEKNIVFVAKNASTLPDFRPDKVPGTKAATTLKDGIYDYKTGFHGNPYYNAKTNQGDKPNEGYAALLPKYSINEDHWISWYMNGDDDFYCDTCSAINIHASGENPKQSRYEANSLGCQTIHVVDYYEFGRKVGFIKSTFKGDPPTSSIGDNLKNALCPAKEQHEYIEVKYILNRNYDEKNKYYSKNNITGFENCKKGVFYPAYPNEHKHIEKCVIE